jgi:hypothetical protein
MTSGRGQQSRRIEKISSEEILIQLRRYLMRARSRGEYLFIKNLILFRQAAYPDPYSSHLFRGIAPIDPPSNE